MPCILLSDAAALSPECGRCCVAWQPAGDTYRGVMPGRSRTAVAPLERLKILMQVQGKERVYRGVVQVRRAYPLAPLSAGEAARHMLRVCETPGQVEERGGDTACVLPL